MLRVKRTGSDVLEVRRSGDTSTRIIGPASPVVELRDGLTRVRVSNDSGRMEIVLCGKGIIEAASLGIDSTYLIDEHGLRD